MLHQYKGYFQDMLMQVKRTQKRVESSSHAMPIGAEAIRPTGKAQEAKLLRLVAAVQKAMGQSGSLKAEKQLRPVSESPSACPCYSSSLAQMSRPMAISS